jgi:hypothetical protein
VMSSIMVNVTTAIQRQTFNLVKSKETIDRRTSLDISFELTTACSNAQLNPDGQVESIQESKIKVRPNEAFCGLISLSIGTFLHSNNAFYSWRVLSVACSFSFVPQYVYLIHATPCACHHACREFDTLSPHHIALRDRRLLSACYHRRYSFSSSIFSSVSFTSFESRLDSIYFVHRERPQATEYSLYVPSI